jgi:Uma2 family endonuclease
MTVANGIISEPAQHIVLDNVSWDFYEHLLEEIGDRPLRVTYDQGSLEIMSPLPKHERWGAWIARLIELTCTELEIPVASLGSTTFRSRPRLKGLEPDKCFYVQHFEEGIELDEEFDPAIHHSPDLAVEIDVTHRSVPREPIYAALRMPELWRFTGSELNVLHLIRGKYLQRSKSLTFPFLPMNEFGDFVARMREKNQLKVIREFRLWVRLLSK